MSGEFDDEYERGRGARAATREGVAEHGRTPGKSTLVEYEAGAPHSSDVPGKSTLVQRAYAGAPDLAVMRSDFISRIAELQGAPAAVQRSSIGEAAARDPAAVATAGADGAASSLPFYDEIQRSFGRHDISGIRAFTGGAAADASKALGARAYAFGDTVAFASSPDLHTAAHEAAHVVQQRAGIAPTGLDGGATDPLERKADAIADAVVAGKSAEELLGPISDSQSTPAAVQRKTAADATGAAIDPETKYTFRGTHSWKIKIAGAPTKVTISSDFGLKDKGSLTASNKIAKDSALSTQRLVEASRDGLDAKIKASLLKGSLDIVSGQLPEPLSALKLSFRVDVSGLDASLSFKKVDLKLATAAVVLEGDLTALLPEDVQHRLDVKGSIRLEIEFDPELAKQIIELGEASEDVKRSAELEAKLAQTEKKLAEAKEAAGAGTAVDLEKIGQGTYRNKLLGEEAARKAAMAETRELEKELVQLNALKKHIAPLREAAEKRIVAIGARLEETALGRLAGKVAGKAFALVFKRFLPIYNAISTAKDIYDAGKFLAGLNWDDIGKKIVDGGDGGSSLADGTHHEGPEGIGGSGDDGQLPDADAIQADLDRREHPVLHPAAQAVLDSVQAKAGNTRPGAKPLSANDQETINAVVPEDLTPDEIKAVSTQLNASGTAPQDTVEAVIAAVQRIRPFGEKPDPASKPDEAGPHVDAKATATPTASKHSAKHAAKSTGAASAFVDPAPELARRITVDPTSGKATYPMIVQVGDVTLRIVDVKTGRVVDGKYLVQVQVLVLGVAGEASLKFRDGPVVAPGVQQTVVFSTAADLTVTAAD